MHLSLRVELFWEKLIYVGLGVTGNRPAQSSRYGNVLNYSTFKRVSFQKCIVNANQCKVCACPENHLACLFSHPLSETTYPFQGQRGAGVDPSWHYAMPGSTLDKSPVHYRGDCLSRKCTFLLLFYCTGFCLCHYTMLCSHESHIHTEALRSVWLLCAVYMSVSTNQLFTCWNRCIISWSQTDLI